MDKRQKGYTLVEIGAVVAIIALVLGGVTSIQRVKQRSIFMSLMDDTYMLKQAYDQFRTIYERLPGDMHDAVTKFGPTYGSFTTEPGNGDGIINYSNNEPVIALQHLAAAGLIKGAYDGRLGMWGTLKGEFIVMPTSSRYNGSSMYFASSSNPDTTGTSVFRKTPDNSSNESMIVVSLVADTVPDGAIVLLTEATLSMISPFDLYQLDKKFDDGYPVLGRLLGADGYDAGASTCVNVGVAPYAYYQLNKKRSCYFALIVERTNK